MGLWLDELNKDGDDCIRLFVSNAPFKTTEEGLQPKLEHLDSVISIMPKAHYGTPRGCALV